MEIQKIAQAQLDGASFDLIKTTPVEGKSWFGLNVVIEDGAGNSATIWTGAYEKSQVKGCIQLFEKLLVELEKN